MTKTQLFATVTWGNKKEENSPSKKIIVEANGYNFDLVFQQGGPTADSRNTFKTVSTITLNKDILRNFVRGLLSGFVTKLRGNMFRKSTDELKPEIFFDGRMTVTNDGKIRLIRLIGGYKIENNKRIRNSILKVYELNGWDEITTIRTEKKYDESKCVFSMLLNTNSVAEDCFSPEDRIVIETLMDTLDPVIIGTSVTYNNHLTRMMAESTSKEEEYSKKNKTVEASGGTVADTTEETAADDFPF